MHRQIRFCGLGGQGIVLAGFILGKACLEAGFNVTQTQSYGPEATGGASRSEVVISDSEIDFPAVLAADILVAMSQPGYDKYLKETAPGALILIDPHYVLNRTEGVFFVEATKIAERVGTRLASNMVMTAVVSELVGLPHAILQSAIIRTLSPSTHKINLAAIEEGFREGERINRIVSGRN
jgi:2-oxoglutarate ferredoxin oxidoreductase subunit gamma